MRASGEIFHSADYWGSIEPPATLLEDRSRYHNNGTFTDGNPDWVKLPSGLWYLNFDDDIVSRTASNETAFQGVPFTFLAWIYPTDLTYGAGGWQNIFGVNASGGATFGLRTLANAELCLSKAGVVDLTRSNFIPTENAWNFIGVTYDMFLGSGNLVYYLNGESDTPFNDNVDFTAGAKTDRFGHSEGYYKGGMIRMRMCAPLNSAEIYSIFQNERKDFGV